MHGLSVTDQVRMFMVAPSSHLEKKSFIAVVADVCAVECAEVANIRKIMFKTKFPATPTPATPTPATPTPATPIQETIIPIAAARFGERMLNWRDKEACGIPLLGMFAVELAQQLTEILSVEFKADMEFPVIADKIKQGKKPSCDTAVCAVTTCDKPVILYEYKPTVDLRYEHVKTDDLMKVLLQGFYCLRQYRVHTVIQCLTDLNQWYYFRLDDVPGTRARAKVQYSWYKEFHGMDVKSHVCFLHPVIQSNTRVTVQPAVLSNS